MDTGDDKRLIEVVEKHLDVTKMHIDTTNDMQKQIHSLLKVAEKSSEIDNKIIGNQASIIKYLYILYGLVLAVGFFGLGVLLGRLLPKIYARIWLETNQNTHIALISGFFLLVSVILHHPAKVFWKKIFKEKE